MENPLARMAPSARSVGRRPTGHSTFNRRLKLWGKVRAVASCALQSRWLALQRRSEPQAATSREQLSNKQRTQVGGTEAVPRSAAPATTATTIVAQLIPS